MSDAEPTTTSETNGALNGATANGTASHVLAARPSGVGRAPKPEDMPKRRSAPRARKPRPVVVEQPEELGAAAAAELDDADELDGEADAIDSATAATAIPMLRERSGGTDRRLPRVKYGATFHAHVWAELVVYCETHDYPIATVLEHAIVRFLMLRGISVPGVWDDPELRALLAVGRAGAEQPR